MSETIKAGWLHDYNGNKFVPKTVVHEVVNTSGASIFSYTDANDDLGSSTKLIYIDNGIFKASSSTRGSSLQPVYLNAGVLTAVGSLGGENSPIYLGTSGFVQGNSTLYNLDTTYTTNTQTATIKLTRGGSDHDSISLIAGDEIKFTRNASTGAITISSYDYYLDPEFSEEEGAVLLATGQGGLTSNLYAPWMTTTVAGVAKAYSVSASNASSLISGKTYGVKISADGVLYVSVPWENDTNTWQEPSYTAGLAISEGQGIDDLYVPYTAQDGSTYGIIKYTDLTSSTWSQYASTTRIYGIECTVDGYGYVEVPWTDTWQANTATQDGYVTAPTTSNKWKVWKTNGQGVPSWQADADRDFYLYAEAGTSAAGNTVASNPYINLYDDGDQYKSGVQLVGGTNITVASDANGVITIACTASSSDTKVQQSLDTSDNSYPILTKWQNSNSGTADIVGYNATCTINHSSGTIYANEFFGMVTAQGVYPATDDVYTLGSHGNYWADVYTHSIVFDSGYEIEYDSSQSYQTVDIKPNLWVSGTASAASFNARSDKRLKTNFRPFEHKDVFDLPLYKFDYTDGITDRVGCLAQDLQQICPEIVHEGKDGYLTIEESKIVYLLLDKMKEMQNEINELKTREGL